MKRMVAWVAYVMGGVIALKSVVAGLSSDSFVEWFTGIAVGIAMWWVAVGFGVRLGVTPDDFVASIKSTLGFGDEFESAEPTPQTPERH